MLMRTDTSIDHIAPNWAHIRLFLPGNCPKDQKNSYVTELLPECLNEVLFFFCPPDA